MKTIKGNLLEATEPVIAHGCNCKGVMGSGVAKAIRAKWPNVFNEYRKKFETEGLRLGDTQLVKIGEGKYVANLMTQQRYGADGHRYVDYDAVRNCFKTLNTLISPGIPIAIPKIGAGLGGGDWNTIKKIIKEEMPDREVAIYEL